MKSAIRNTSLKKYLLVLYLLVATCYLLPASDFGLLFDNKIEAGKEQFAYTPGFTPWFSWNNGQGVSVYLSGLISFKYINDDVDSGWRVPILVPEISRFSLNYRINQRMSLEAGRFSYTDILSFTALGLFDGLRFDTVMPIGNISAAVFYTGLQYKDKETGEVILMTGADKEHYATSWDFGSFGGYFASSRLFIPIRWAFPLGETGTLSAEILAQFDLNNTDDKLHSQYGTVQFEFYPKTTMRVTVGGLFETMQNSSGDFGTAFGLLAKLKMELPTPLNDALGFTVKFTSGSDDGISAFTPISSVSQGSVFSGTIAGLALIEADYTARINNALLAEGTLRYFIKTYNDDTADGNLYGGELWASLAWQPFDDTRATLGAGAFFPGMGNIDPNGDVMWKIRARVILSF